MHDELSFCENSWEIFFSQIEFTSSSSFRNVISMFFICAAFKNELRKAFEHILGIGTT